MKNKVFIVIETYTEDAVRDENNQHISVNSVHDTLKGAGLAIESRHDEIIEEIIDGDENELSRISEDDFVRNDDGITTESHILNDNCNEWGLSIIEKELLRLNTPLTSHRFF